eukprot:1780144-Prymnesium_polylepis.2
MAQTSWLKSGCVHIAQLGRGLPHASSSHRAAHGAAAAVDMRIAPCRIACPLRCCWDRVRRLAHPPPVRESVLSVA